MKKIKIALLVSSLIATSISAKEDLTTKITNFYTILTNNTIKFEATNSTSDSLIIKLIPQNISYKKLLDKNASIKLELDEGPLVLKPKFTLAKAGLAGKIDLISIFNKKIQTEVRKDIKNIFLDYKAIVSFTNNLKENITIAPLQIEDKDIKFTSSSLAYNSNIDLDKFVGKLGFLIKDININSKKDNSFLKLNNLAIKYNITNPPEDKIILYSKNSINLDKIELKDKNINLKFKFSINSQLKKVDENYVDFYSHTKASSNDINTIAFAKGVKEVDFKLDIKNLGKKGIIDLIKLSNELDDLEAQTLHNTNDPEATAKYLAKLDEVTNKLVIIYNSAVQKDKTKIISNLTLLSDKKSFIKLNLLYKAPPIKGDINSAFLNLLSHGLAIFDGDFDIEIERDLITSINPFAVIVFDMLKKKGFAKDKNGIYIIKGKLKDGKVIIDGKAYNLQQLNQALF